VKVNLKVTLRFVGSLAHKAGGSNIEFELPESTTLSEAIVRIFKAYKLGNVEVDENGLNVGFVRIYLNGRIMPMSTALKEEDEISFLPPVAGGSGTKP